MIVDALQDKIMLELKDSGYDKLDVLNVLLSISISIAKELDPEPIKVITEKATEIHHWQERKN